MQNKRVDCRASSSLKSLSIKNSRENDMLLWNLWPTWKKKKQQTLHDVAKMDEIHTTHWAHRRRYQLGRLKNGHIFKVSRGYLAIWQCMLDQIMIEYSFLYPTKLKSRNYFFYFQSIDTATKHLAIYSEYLGRQGKKAFGPCSWPPYLLILFLGINPGMPKPPTYPVDRQGTAASGPCCSWPPYLLILFQGIGPGIPKPPAFISLVF